MAFTVFEKTCGLILTKLSGMNGVADTLMGWVAAPILAGLTILIMWHGFNIIRGAGGNHHLLDVFMKSMRAFLVVSLALGTNTYNPAVRNIIRELRSGLTDAFITRSNIPGSSASTGNVGDLSSYIALDTSMDKAFECLNTIFSWGWENISIGWDSNLTGLVAIGCGLFMVVCLTLFALVSAINLLMIDFSLAIIFGIAPLFIACFAFESTAKFFDAWLAAALKYTFTAVVIAAAVGLGTAILKSYTDELQATAGTLDFVITAFAALASSGILIALVTRAPSIAADIVGGMAISVLGPAAAVAPIAAAAAAMKKTGGAMTNAASYGAGKFAGNSIDSLTSTSLGQKAIAATKGMRNLNNAVSGKIEGGPGGAKSKGSSGSKANEKPSLGATMANAYRIGKDSRPRPAPHQN